MQIANIGWDPIDDWYVWPTLDPSEATRDLRAAAPADDDGERLVRAVLDVEQQLTSLDEACAGAVWVPEPASGSVGAFGSLTVIPVDGRSRRAPKQFCRGVLQRPTIGPDGTEFLNREAEVFRMDDEYTYVHLWEQQIEPEQGLVWTVVTSTLFMKGVLGAAEISTRTPHATITDQYPLIHAALMNSILPVTIPAP